MAMTVGKRYRQLNKSGSFYIAFWIGLLVGTIAPFILYGFTSLSPVVALVAYIGTGLGPFIGIGIAMGAMAIYFLIKAGVEAYKINHNLMSANPPANQQRVNIYGHNNARLRALLAHHNQQHRSVQDIARERTIGEYKDWFDAQAAKAPKTVKVLFTKIENFELSEGDIDDPDPQTKDQTGYHCSISQGIMCNPVLAPDGNVYDWDNIARHIRECLDPRDQNGQPETDQHGFLKQAKIPTSPLTNLPMPKGDFKFLNERKVEISNRIDAKLKKLQEKDLNDDFGHGSDQGYNY